MRSLRGFRPRVGVGLSTPGCNHERREDREGHDFNYCLLMMIFVTLTRRSLFSWQRIGRALVSRSCQHWSEDTARQVWLRLCRAVTFVVFAAFVVHG